MVPRAISGSVSHTRFRHTFTTDPPPTRPRGQSMRLYPTSNPFVSSNTAKTSTTSKNKPMSNLLNGMDDTTMFHSHWRLKKRKPTPQVDKAAIFREQERMRDQLTSQLKHLGAWEMPTKRPTSSSSSSNNTVSTKASWSSSSSGSRSVKSDVDTLSSRHVRTPDLPELVSATYGKPSDVGKTFEGYEKKRICVDAPRTSADVPVVYPFITEGWRSGDTAEKLRPHSAPAVNRPSTASILRPVLEQSHDDMKNRQYGKKSEIGKLFVTPGGKRITLTRNESTVFLGGRI